MRCVAFFQRIVLRKVPMLPKNMLLFHGEG